MVLEMKPETGFGHMSAEVSLEWEAGILAADIQVNNADENKPLRAYLKNGTDYFYLGLLEPSGTTAALQTQKACADTYSSMFLCIGRVDEEHELVMSGRIIQEMEDEVEELDETVAEMESIPGTEITEDSVAIEDNADKTEEPEVEEIEEAEDMVHVEVEEKEEDGADETDETLEAEEKEVEEIQEEGKEEKVETAQASPYLGVEWEKCLPEELNCQSEAEAFLFSHPSVKANLKFYGHYCRAELDCGTVYAFASTFGPHALPHLAKYAYWHDVDLGFGHKGYFLIGLKGDEYFFVK